MKKYFFEIKNRFILLCVTLLSISVISYLHKETLLFTVIQPNLSLNECKNNFYLIFTNVLEVFTVYLKLILFLILQIGFIYLFYHTFTFLSPGFFYLEYLYFKFFIKIALVVWVLSVVLSTFILIPFSWNFFLGFQNLIIAKSLNLHFEAKLNEYFSFYISFYYLCESYCQFIVLFILILNYRSSNVNFIKKFRKLYYYGFIIFSILISSTDVVSQISISLIFILIYECSILFFLFKLIN